MKKDGYSNRTDQTHRFRQSVGKQYLYGKGQQERYEKTQEELIEYLEAKTKSHKLEELSNRLKLIPPSQTRRHNTKRNQQNRSNQTNPQQAPTK